MLWTIITWPLILLGFVRGAFDTYVTYNTHYDLKKKLTRKERKFKPGNKDNLNTKEKDEFELISGLKIELQLKNEENKQKLKYWVVISALLWLFPKIDYILSFFLFSGLVGLIKFGLLFMVIMSKSGAYGFLYELVSEQLVGSIKPTIDEYLKKSKGFRQDCCGNILIWSAFISRPISNTFMHNTTDQHIKYFLSAIKKIEKDIKEFQKVRAIQQEKNDKNNNNKDIN